MREPLPDVNYCYCETCRKLSGGTYSIVARIPISMLKILKGNQRLHMYSSSLGKHRYYCNNCCSPIFVSIASEPEFVRVRLGVLDFDCKVNVVAHIWVSEKPKWHQITDDLPQYQEWQNSDQEWP